MADMKDFYYKEWHYAEKEGNVELAKNYKEKYRNIVMGFLKRKHKQYFNKLKQFPMINLN